MADIVLENLGTVGIIKDIPDYDLPPEAFSDGKNVSFRNKRATYAFGQEVYVDTIGVPTLLQQTFTGTDSYWIWNEGAGFKATDGTTTKTLPVTPAWSFDYDRPCTGGVYHGFPLFSNGMNDPVYWGKDFSTPSAMLPLPNWPSGWLARIVRPWGNFILLADMVEGGNRIQDKFRWSASASPGAFPSVYQAAAGNDAGEAQCSETDGPITAMDGLGNFVLIYKSRGVYRAEYVGGNTVFAVRKHFDDLSCLTAGALTRISKAKNGVPHHFVMTTDFDLVMTDGYSRVSVATDSWKQWIQRNISEDLWSRTFCVYNPRRREVWTCIPLQGATAWPNMALIWNVDDGQFTTRDLPEASAAAWGIVSAVGQPKIWDNQTTRWDDFIGYWDERNFNATDTHLLFAGGSSKIYQENSSPAWADAPGSVVTRYLERTGLGITGRDRQGNWTVDQLRRKLLKRIWPRVKIQGIGQLQLYGLAQDKPDGPVRISGPHVLRDGEQFVDPLISGIYLGWKIESTTDVRWELEGITVEIEMLGRF